MIDARALELLRNGTLTVAGRLYEASNLSFRATVADGADELACVYKPTAGERPLRDFPDGTLAHREVASYRVSAATGWRIVPPTALREEGPLGPGMAQAWIEVDERVDIAGLLAAADPRLRRVAILDAITNNTDRKGGHLLVAPDGHLWGVDHGVTFSTHPKLRTILWSWRGQPFDADELAALRGVRAALDGDLGRALRRLLQRSEVDATTRRVDGLLASGVFPFPNPDWPAVPWPPF